MKTEVHEPVFYLASQNLVIKISRITVIGRSKGDVLIEDDELLSSEHCEIAPAMLQAVVRDLGSTNGVYVNDVRILPETGTKISTGDKLRIGSADYFLFQSMEEVNKKFPPKSRRRYPRPENLTSPQNLLNFYSAPPYTRWIYLFVILLSVGSFIYHLEWNPRASQHLDFLSELYRDEVIFRGVELILLVWLTSLFHSFFMVLYFNRDPFRIAAGLALYFVCLFQIVSFVSGPLAAIRTYLNATESSGRPPSERSIIALNDLRSERAQVKRAYRHLRNLIPQDKISVLDSDFQKLLLRFEQDMRKLEVPKQKE